LNSFGAILTFAIDLEGTLQRFYEEAGNLGGANSELFQQYAKQSAKRKRLLTQTRQDNVTEMVLEPISGLVQADYEPEVKQPSSADAALSEAIKLETRSEQFYTDAGPKLNVTEPRRVFQKLARENGERLTELRELAK
jgi:rubrerythrin